MDVTARADQWPRRALREAIIGRCEVLFSPETSAFARALILGNQNCLSKKTISSFREAGAVHVLAASGLHVAILAAIPLALMGAIRTRRKIILCVTMAVLLAYLYVTDMPVSLMRACVMFGIVTIQHLWSLRGNSLNSLFLAAVALLCHSPADLFTLGFQLSFGATLGILCFHGLYSAALSGVRLYGPVRSSMAVTLAAQMVVTPIVLARLGETTYLSILSNLIIIPVTAATFIAALAALALHPLSPPLAFCAGHAVDQAFTLLQNAAGLFSSLQGRVCVDGIDPTVALALALLAAPLAPRMRKKTALLCLIIAHALLFTLPLRQHTCPWESIIFEDSTGRTVLVRRGSHVALAGTIASRSAAQAISAEIEEKPYSSLELAIPQADPCTMRHFTRIIKSCRVDRCHIEPHFLFNDDFRELCRIAQADSVTLEVMKTIGNTDATDSKKNEALHQALHLYYLRPGKPSRRFRKEGQYKNKLHAIHGR
jgi:ComEC/Rec2-related protein